MFSASQADSQTNKDSLLCESQPECRYLRDERKLAILKTALKLILMFPAFVLLLAIAAILGDQHEVTLIDIRAVADKVLGAAQDFFGSAFAVAAVGSGLAAFAGAVAAQRIIERSKQREDLLREIRNTNASIMVAFSISNSLLSLKKQHVKSLRDTFETQVVTFACHQTRVLLRRPVPLAIHFDFRSLSPPELPLDVLQTQVFEKLSLTGRALGLMTALRQSATGLSQSIIARNELVAKFRSRQVVNSIELLPEYLGLPQGRKQVIDQNYPDYVKAIYAQTDDGIFFSNLLAKDLMEHGKKIAARFKATFGEGAPNINALVYEEARVAGLMPDESNYADWLTMFLKAPPKT
jgi:hypothetical protein